MSGRIRLAHELAVSTLTITREESLNSLDRATLEELAGAIKEVAARKETRCLIVTGAGNKAFVAGADIAAMSQMSPVEAIGFARLGQATFGALEALRMPVIAALHGFALGGGCELALACDFIIASDKAKIGQPEVKLGVVPGFGGTQRLARRVGLGLARELIYTGRMLSAEEALRVGLVNAVVPSADLMARVAESAASIAAVSPAAVARAKAVMNAGYDRPLHDAIELEAHAFGACFEHDDQREGMSAFLAKRPPVFRD